MKRVAADQHDIACVQAWTEVFADILALIPPLQRGEVLQRLTDKPQRGHDKPLHWCDYMRDCEAAMRLRSLVIQVLVERIRFSQEHGDAGLVRGPLRTWNNFARRDDLPVVLLP